MDLVKLVGQSQIRLKLISDVVSFFTQIVCAIYSDTRHKAWILRWVNIHVDLPRPRYYYKVKCS